MGRAVLTGEALQWGGRVSLQSTLEVRQRSGPREPLPEAEGPLTGILSPEMKITSTVKAPYIPVLVLLCLLYHDISHLPRRQTYFLD